MTLNGQQPHKLVSNDLDSSLANLVGSKFPFFAPMFTKINEINKELIML